MKITEEQVNNAVKASNADQREISAIAALIRDITKVGFMPKSEAQRRINELLDARTRAVIDAILDEIGCVNNKCPYCEDYQDGGNFRQHLENKFLTTKPNERILN